MIIIDDRLSIDALAGHAGVEAMATTWGFHYRLVRALADGTRWGVLATAATDAVRRLVADPPESRLIVLDPRIVTAEAAALASHHQLNLLAAELIASAVHYQAELRLSAPNVGRRWPEVIALHGVALTIV